MLCILNYFLFLSGQNIDHLYPTSFYILSYQERQLNRFTTCPGRGMLSCIKHLFNSTLHLPKGIRKEDLLIPVSRLISGVLSGACVQFGSFPEFMFKFEPNCLYLLVDLFTDGLVTNYISYYNPI